METEKQAVRIPLDQADAKALTDFATLILGLEVRPGTNATQLRGKIRQAVPDIKDIPAPREEVAVPAPVAASPLPTGYVPVDGEDPIARPAAISMPPSEALTHAERDPKVKIRVFKTPDKTKPREVTIQNGGYVVRLRRGEAVEVPLRIYFTLLDAKEMARVDSDDIDPVTQTHLWSWEEVQSYPFEVLAMPSAEEIAAWQQATGTGFQKVR